MSKSPRKCLTGDLLHNNYLKMFLFFMLWFIFIGVVYAPPVFAETEEIQIVVIPENIEIIPGRDTEIQISIKNLTDNNIKDIKLSYFTTSKLKINIEPSKYLNLEPHGVLNWVLTLSQLEQERINGTIHFRVNYFWQKNESKELIPGIAYQSLNVNTQIPEAIQTLPEIEVKTAITNLVEGQPGIIYVIISNRSELPIRVINIEADGPDFVHFNLKSRDFNIPIKSNNIQIYRYKVETDQSIIPGKYLLIFKVDFIWDDINKDYPGSVFETHEIDVSVFGESGIMSVLGLAIAGIPTFLILPGFLILITIGVLRRWITPKAGDYTFKNLLESFKRPEFWFWVFTLSFLMIPIYSFGSRLLGVPRDLLKGYSFIDITIVWFGSILLAASGFILFAIIKAIVPIARNFFLRIYFDWKNRQLIPSMNDSPIEILEKLDRQDLGVFRERVPITIQGQQLDNPAYLLQSIEDNKEKYWVSPRIKVLWKANRTQEEEKIFEDAKKQLTQEGNDAGILASKLSKAYNRKIIKLTWEATNPINMKGPLPINVGNLQFPPLTAISIVTMEENLE
jgi:hypothetical protein